MIQLQVLNRILDSKDSSIITLNNIDESFFSDYPDEFKYIKNHLDEYQTIPDKYTFCDKFPDFDVIEVGETNSYLLSELYKDKNARNLASVFNQVRKKLNDGDVEGAISIYTNAQSIASSGKFITSVDILKDTTRYDDYIERCHNYNKFYVKTGFKELDDAIGGWDRQEELATIVARPGVGKTWVLLKSSVAALEQGLRVGVYSGEMSERKVGYRFDTLIGHVSNYGISKGDDSMMNEYKKHIEYLQNKYPDGGYLVLTPSMIDGPATVNALKAFIETEHLDILFVDQHSLLEDDRKAKNPVDRAANISRDLKNLQVLKKIPIIAVSQQNRVESDEGPSSANISQSDRIGQDSTAIIFVSQKDNVMTLTLGKSRDSVAGKKINYAIDLNKGIFTFIPEGEEVTQESHTDADAENEGDYF